MTVRTVFCLLDGMRYDALELVHKWVGLPAMQDLINNGVLFENVWSYEPLYSRECIGRIVTGDLVNYKTGETIFGKLGKRGLKTMCVGAEQPQGRGATTYHDNLYGNPRVGSGKYSADQTRVEIALREMEQYNFTFVYFVEPDDNAHICRDQKRHVYSWQSPYIWAIKRGDQGLGRIKAKLDSLKQPYNIIVMADHGMTDQGQHWVATWRDKDVTHVPLIAYGHNFKSGLRVKDTMYITDVIHGIISLYDRNYRSHIFNNALK